MIKDYRKQIKELEKKILRIQEACTHPEPAVIKTYHSDRDNYDRPNKYWVEKYCSLCTKVWAETTNGFTTSIMES